MSSLCDILARAKALGVTLTVEGSRIAIRPGRRLSRELFADIKAHKTQLMALLEAVQYQVRPDCVPWLHVARQVLAGEFDGGDRSQLESVLIGVTSIRVPCCQEARVRLEALLATRRELRR